VSVKRAAALHRAEAINAHDNTIAYADHVLAQIEILREAVSPAYRAHAAR
jgi:hypothetical protein